MSNSNSDRKLQAGIVLCFFVAGFTWIFWHWLDYQHVNAVSNMYETSSYKERADQRVTDECGAASATGFFECRYAIEQSTRDAHRAQKDLKAQRYMALWAFVMAISSLVGVVVTFVGVIFIKSTLDQTREAVRAADDAVKVTREIGEAQTRAYLSVSSVNIHLCNGNLLLPPDWGIGLRIDFENYGVSPAKSVGFTATVSVNKYLLKAKTNFVICNSHIAPGGTKQTNTFQSVPIVLDSRGTHKKGKFILKRNQNVRLELKVRYSDVFNRSYETRGVWDISIQDADLTRFGMAKLERWGNEDNEAEIR